MQIHNKTRPTHISSEGRGVIRSPSVLQTTAYTSHKSHRLILGMGMQSNTRPAFDL